MDEAIKAARRKPITRNLPVYNYGATAEDRIILELVDQGKRDIKSAFLDGEVDYYRTISSDGELAEVLAEELRRREIDLCPEQISRNLVPARGTRCPHPHHDRVFLLSEWDTAYGRYLPQSVSETFGADDSTFGGCRLNTSHGVMHASYLRGLDGRLPSRRPAKGSLPAGSQDGGQPLGQSAAQNNGGEPSATPETANRFESAEGQSQFDYLRRLTDTLKKCDEKLRLEGKGKIAAIGVLGSDVYDKLLLLQALRPEFLEATFFTTNLDELLLPQEKLRYTRNLLVASSYGLTLIPEMQKDILPFRSSYQTFILRAISLAIRNGNLLAPKTDANSDPWPDTTAALDCGSKQPLLFQIGRTTARRLPTDSLGSANEACAKASFERRACLVIHLLHIRKTGGTALWHAIEAHALTDRREIIHHPHTTLLSHVPRGEKAIFFLRDPLPRFASGFYCRQRQGLPRYDSPWKHGERAAFERFQTPNELARTLSSPHRVQRELAWAAMGNIQHLCSTLTWLESEAYLRSRLPEIFYIGFQETLNEDFEHLKQKLGLPAHLRLSDDEVAAHRNPAHLDYHLDDLAVANLRAWYETDQRMLDFCRASRRG